MWNMIEEAYTNEDKSQMVDHFNNNTRLFDEKKYSEYYGVWFLKDKQVLLKRRSKLKKLKGITKIFTDFLLNWRTYFEQNQTIVLFNALKAK